MTPTDVLSRLKELSEADMNPHNGRMFGHIYETGDPQLRTIAEEAYKMYMWKNMLDPTVYPSIITLEKELVKGIGMYFNLPEDGAGTFTYGGTESILLAVLGAREHYRRKKGRTSTMEIVLPETAHPAFHKAAHLLGVKTRVVKVDREEYTVNPEAIASSLTEETGMIVLSAPNYPFGTIDPIREVSELVENKDTWIHVDSCIGTILPFLRLEGAEVPPADFTIEGVTSISTDMHKYGYSPKNGSLIFFRDRKLREHTLFTYSRWAGYPLVNTTILSSRSAGSLAASWAVYRYLGEEGYRLNARKVWRARDSIINGLRKLRYTVQGNPLGGVFSFTSSDVNVFILAEEMRKRKWYIQAQPGSQHLGYMPSIHMTIAPIHESLVDEFLKDLAEATGEIRGKPLPPARALEFAEKTGLFELASKDPTRAMDALAEAIGLDKGAIGDEALVNELIHLFPPEMVEEVLKYFISYVYS